MTTPEFDPQHDARFQRGYDPTAEDGAAAEFGQSAGSGRQPEASFGSRAAAREVVARAKTGLRSGDAASAATGPETDAGPDTDTETETGDFVRGSSGVDEFAPESRALRRNPFVIVLWVLAPLLMAGGFALVVQAAQNMNYSYTGNEIPWGMVLQQLAWSLAPTMLSTGLATIMGLLFWHAFAWRRGRTAALSPRTTAS